MEQVRDVILDVIEKKFTSFLIPVCSFYPRAYCVIGSKEKSGYLLAMPVTELIIIISLSCRAQLLVQL